MAFEINRVTVQTAINNNLLLVAKMVLKPFQLGDSTTAAEVYIRRLE
jgi:hypothetical protein